MVSALDVARYLLTLVDQDAGDLMSNLKLQKLLYYSQGYHLALYGQPLFHEDIVAWQYGPVVREVYHEYKFYGREGIPAPECFDSNVLPQHSRQVIIDVYEQYGQYEASVLMHFTHEEAPWQHTDKDKVITHQKLQNFFKTQLV